MRFQMVGKLSLPKESESFNPYETKKYDSGWMSKILKFNAICGDNRHFLTIQGGCFSDGHGDIKIPAKKSKDDEETKILTIPFKERKTSPLLSDVADFRKLVIDLEERGRRNKLETLVKKLDDEDELTIDDYKSVGLPIGQDIKQEFENSKKRYHEFISEIDYGEFVHKVLMSDKYKDKQFLIYGNIEYSYSPKNKKYYSSYVPNRIYLAPNDMEPLSVATVPLVYNNDSIDDVSQDEEHKFYVQGYVFEYERSYKKKVAVPVTVAVEVPDKEDELEYKKAMRIKSKFTVDDDEYKELGVDVDMLNGAQRTEITDDMLTDDQKEDLELGLITMADIRAEMGQVYGDVVREFRFRKIARGYTKGRIDTVYTEDDMLPPKTVTESAVDMFNDDDDDDLDEI